MSLQGEDFEVHLAESAETAMSLAREMEFDLIITDYRLEKEDGLSFTERIKNSSPDTKVFILTAYGTDELRTKAQKLGVEAFIDKPFDLSFLTSEVKKHLTPTNPENPVYP
jgi:DNA-binding response OmpR family regulator